MEAPQAKSISILCFIHSVVLRGSHYTYQDPKLVWISDLSLNVRAQHNLLQPRVPVIDPVHAPAGWSASDAHGESNCTLDWRCWLWRSIEMPSDADTIVQHSLLSIVNGGCTSSNRI